MEFADSIAYGRLRVTDRAEIDRRLASQPSWNPFRFFQQGKARDPKFHIAVYRGWLARDKGERAAVAREGLTAIGLKPWRIDGWKLLACSAFKPSPKTS